MSTISGSLTTNLIESLPPEVQMNILLNLDIKDLTKLRGVNKTIKDLIDSEYLWDKINDKIGIIKPTEENKREKVIHAIAQLHEITPIDYPSYDSGYYFRKIETFKAEIDQNETWFHKLSFYLMLPYSLHDEREIYAKNPNNPQMRKITVESTQALLQTKRNDTLVVWKKIQEQYKDLEYPNFEKLKENQIDIIHAFDKWIEENKSFIQNLDLSDINVNYLPDSIGKLDTLKELDICENPLRTIPDSFKDLQLLRFCYSKEINEIFHNKPLLKITSKKYRIFDCKISLCINFQFGFTGFTSTASSVSKTTPFASTHFGFLDMKPPFLR